MSYQNINATQTLASLMQQIEGQIAYQPKLIPVLRHIKRAYAASIENDRDPSQPN